MKAFPIVGLSSVFKKFRLFILRASAGSGMERNCKILPQAVYLFGFFPLWRGNPSLVLSLSSICCSKGL